MCFGSTGLYPVCFPFESNVGSKVGCPLSLRTIPVSLSTLKSLPFLVLLGTSPFGFGDTSGPPVFLPPLFLALLIALPPLAILATPLKSLPKPNPIPPRILLPSSGNITPAIETASHANNPASTSCQNLSQSNFPALSINEAKTSSGFVPSPSGGVLPGSGTVFVSS